MLYIVSGNSYYARDRPTGTMIAISYRREDSTSIAGRLHDRLRAEFGKENVFMDFDSIPYGVDFRDHIAQTLETAEVLVAVIGPGWLGHRLGESTRRIDDATDFVRLEIAGALQRGIPVIPVLVDKTPMPIEDALPNDLKPLVFRNGLMLDTGIDFHHHADRLVKGIRSLLKTMRASSRRGFKKRPRSSPAFTRDSDDRPAAAGRFKWLGIFDRLKSPTPSQPYDHEHGAKPVSLRFGTDAATPAPEEVSTQSSSTERGAREAAPSETSQLIDNDRDFERYGGGTSERPSIGESITSAPKQISAQAGGTKGAAGEAALSETSQLIENDRDSERYGGGTSERPSISESVTSAPKQISAQAGGTKGAAGEAALSETSQVIERNLDFERYGGGTIERPKEQSAPPAASTPEFAPPVRAPAVSIKHSSITPPPPAVTVAQDSDGPKRLHNSFFNAKLLGLVVAGAFIAFVAYVVVTSRTKSTPSSTEKVAQPSVPATQASPSITPESSQVPSATVATNSSQSASEISSVQESTPSKAPSEATSSSPTLDQTPLPVRSPEVATTSPAPEQAPLAKNGRTWQVWIGDFVRQFVAANQSKDANATLALYTSTVDYFDDHHADQAFIRRDIEKYNERWPIRQDSIEGDINLQEKIPDQEYTASFKLNFYAESLARAVWTKGQFAIDLAISIVNGIPRISGIKEKMLHQQKGKPSSTPSNNAPRKSYAYGIPIQGKPGFVRSPYAPSKGEIDITRYRKGTQLKCPFTGKIFIAP